MVKKHLCASLLVGILAFSNICTTVHAYDVNSIDNEIILETSDISYQLSDLYSKIGIRLGVKSEYIRLLHSLSENMLEYYTYEPNIYRDLAKKECIKINGANIIYQKAEFIDTTNINRQASAYYLPDALYSISYDIVALMSQRYNYNRGGMQIYFDALSEEAKKDIIFYESVMLYTGEDEETVNKFYSAYEKIMYDKQVNESIIDENGYFKSKYAITLKNIGVKNLKYLAKVMNNNTIINENDNIENIKDTYTLPYKLDYTSRENMMIAAMSVVGKVRYIWGGGHCGTSNINGINPVWSLCNQEYNNSENTAYTCIKPSGSWCITHGYSNDTCDKEDYYNTLGDYLESRSKILDNSDILTDKYSDILNTIDYETYNISGHNLDGLDCSGYISWVFNQITDNYIIDSTAANFKEVECFTELDFGSDLLPGDIFAWKTHIVMIIGKVRNESKAYVTIEQTPNVVKFGVVYYKDASEEDIEYAKNIAKQANLLLGGIDCEKDRVGCYCMDTVKYYNEIVDDVEVLREFSYLGRFKDQYIDENSSLNENNDRIIDLNALDIIQYTITKLPIAYISGFDVYEEDLFNKRVVSSNLGISIENILVTSN